MTTDAFGNEITIGDKLTYAVRSGAKHWLNQIQVTEVFPDQVRGFDIHDVRRRYKTLKSLKTTVVTNDPGDSEERVQETSNQR